MTFTKVTSPDTDWEQSNNITYIMTEGLDFLMTEDNDYLICENSVSAFWSEVTSPAGGFSKNTYSSHAWTKV